jgi:hypothetical protein
MAARTSLAWIAVGCAGLGLGCGASPSGDGSSNDGTGSNGSSSETSSRGSSNGSSHTGVSTGSTGTSTGTGSATGSNSGASESSGTATTATTTGSATTTPSGTASSSTHTSSSSSSNGTSSAGAATPCSFASGLNVAWVNFANDVPNPNLTTFNTIFKNTFAAGGRVIRWWFHTNGTVTPGYQTSGTQAGMAQMIPQSHIDGVTSILNAAHSAGVAINVSLWSFDMLQGGESIPAATATNNMNLLTVDANRQAYIDNYLTPLVKALKGNPGLYSYEIFNEPEGMTPAGWTVGNGGESVPESAIQRSVNWLAAAIHAADPTALVTSSAVTFHYASTVAGNASDYSDSALMTAGGKQGGTLDFYEVHYYESNGTQYSCFLHPASYWGLDKKIVMGEFYAATTDGVAQNNTYTYLQSNGYSGAWAWSYESDMPWPSMQTPMQNLYTAQTSTVGACP